MYVITYWLSLIMIFTISWENIIYIDAIGTISRSIGLMLASFWVLTVISSNRVRKPNAFHLACFIFVFWSATSIFWSENPDESLESLFTNFQLLVLVYIVWDLYVTPASVRAAMQAIVLGAWVVIASIVMNYIAGVQEVYQRFSATGFGANQAGFVLALSLPLAWYLIITGDSEKDSAWMRIINVCFIPSAIFAILLTASRSAFLSTAPAIFYVLASLPRIKMFWRTIGFVTILASVLAILPFVPTSSLDRVNIRGLDDRTAIWLDAVDSISEHPILGVGLGAYRGATTGKVAHNSALAVLAELGIIGFVLFCTLLLTALGQLRLLPKSIRYLWLAVFFVWLINSIGNSYEYSKQIWLFLGLMVANAHLPIRPTEISHNVSKKTISA